MCGFIFLRTEKPLDSSKVYEATKILSYRGPDKNNFVQFKELSGKNIFALHYLLDISGKSVMQPLISKNELGEKILLLFNGEIYNFLKNNFLSDTDYLVNFFHQVKNIKNETRLLDGEYAILIYNEAQKCCDVYVDAFLTKPLFFGQKNNNSDFGISTYASSLDNLGFEQIKMFEPNHSYRIKFDGKYNNIKKFEDAACKFNIDQFKEDSVDWENAFIEAVKKRATHGVFMPFVSLSSGYDSGAICCALNKLKIKYETFSILENENIQILKERIKINKSMSCQAAHIIEGVTRNNISKIKDNIKKNTESLTYFHQDKIGINLKIEEDGGSIGSDLIGNIASSKKFKIHLSSCGADEIISDYGMNGEKIFLHSEFNGVFPDDLKKIFPWKKFYGDSQRSYLFKEEFIFGRYGIESRYPFLDLKVVQEYLSISASLKNSEYKFPILNFLKKNNYPVNYNVKSGFNPVHYKISERIISKIMRIKNSFLKA
jgi:asparagine synthetase B (glutamine-hydrolysing)